MENTSNEKANHQAIEFHHLPMSPSVNDTLTSVRGRLIKTNVARAFQARVQRYFRSLPQSQKDKIEEFKKQLSAKRPQDRKILFEAKFYFPKGELFKKTNPIGEPKRKDTSNRIKQLEDRVSENIGIDDKYFFFVWCSKHEMIDQSPKDLEDGHCSVRLSFVQSSE